MGEAGVPTWWAVQGGMLCLDRGCKPLLGPLTPRPHTLQDPEEHQRLKKKQRNRAAAQRSRQKHTDKADALHQVGLPSFPRPDSTHLARPPRLHPPMSSSPYTLHVSRSPEFERGAEIPAGALGTQKCICSPALPLRRPGLERGDKR